MILGALQIVAMAIAPLEQSIANLNLWLLQWILGVVRIVGSLPYAHVVMTPAPAWAIAAYDAALLAAICLGKRERWTPAIALLVCAVANVLAPLPALDGKLRITALDVGQADSIEIQTPRGHVLLVDGGGRLERGPLVDGASVAERVGEVTVAVLNPARRPPNRCGAAFASARRPVGPLLTSSADLGKSLTGKPKPVCDCLDREVCNSSDELSGL